MKFRDVPVDETFLQFDDQPKWDVVLPIARIMADLLQREPGVEVHLIRDDDTYVAPWDRGEIATPAGQ